MIGAVTLASTGAAVMFSAGAGVAVGFATALLLLGSATVGVTKGGGGAVPLASAHAADLRSIRCLMLPPQPLSSASSVAVALAESYK